MPINENLAKSIQRYKLERDLSIAELAEELGVAKSILESYLRGTGNPRADTLELLSERSGIPLSALVTGLPSGGAAASAAAPTAKLFGSLAEDRRERCVELFVEMVRLMSPAEK